MKIRISRRYDSPTACLLAIVMTLCAQPSCASIVYVNKNATGVHNGRTWATAYLTVQAAVNAAVSGDEVWVAVPAPASPAYEENLLVSKSIALYGGFIGMETLRGQRDWKTNNTVLNASTTPPVVLIDHSAIVTVDGFTIRNHLTGLGGVWVDSGTVTVSNNNISGNAGHGVRTYSGTLTLTGNSICDNIGSGVYGPNGQGIVKLTNNIITGNHGYGVEKGSGSLTMTGNTVSANGNAGVRVSSGGVATVTNNIIARNGGSGISSSERMTLKGNTISDNMGYGVVAGGTLTGNTVSGNGDYGFSVFDRTTLAHNTIVGNAGIGVSATGTPTLTNNTITGNGGDGMTVNTLGTAVITNNIVAFNGGYGMRPTDGSIQVFSHNNVYGNTKQDYVNFTLPADQGNISLDPSLSNIYHDIHLLSGSPCIDAGDDSAVWGITDVNGRPRKVGAHVDIGSDEYDGTTWVVPVHTWRVSPSGSDDADGLTWATAKKTVGAALSASRGPDEVWIAKGTFVEAVSLHAGVSLFGGFTGTESERSERNVSANPTILHGGGTSDVITSHFLNVVVDGLTIRNGRKGVYVYDGTITLANNIVSGNTTDGILIAGTAILTNNTISGNRTGITALGRTTLTNNTISGNTDGVYVQYTTTTTGNTISGNNAHGVVLDSAVMTMTNDIVSANGSHGIMSDGSLTMVGATISNNGGNGVYVERYDQATLSNSLIFGNLLDGVGCTENSGAYLFNDTICDNGGNGVSVNLNCLAQVTNCILVGNHGYGLSHLGNSLGFSHNNVYGNKMGEYSNYTPPANPYIISVDPLFVNPQTADYHLQTGSPCIDTGYDSAVIAGARDRDGRLRTIGLHPDMGAYEYGVVGSYTLSDTVTAMRIIGGLSKPVTGEFDRLNVDRSGKSLRKLDLFDVVWITRRALGIDPASLTPGW